MARVTKIELQQRNAALAAENDALRHRVSQLEADLARSTQHVDAVAQDITKVFVHYADAAAAAKATARIERRSVRVVRCEGGWEVVA